MELKGYLGTVSFDGGSVRIAKKTRGTTAFAAADVTSVAIVPAGIGMKAIKFTVAGGTPAGPVKTLGTHRALAEDPYALTFRSKRSGEFEALAQQVQAAR